jgi:hypothetical protein
MSKGISAIFARMEDDHPPLKVTNLKVIIMDFNAVYIYNMFLICFKLLASSWHGLHQVADHARWE